MKKPVLLVLICLIAVISCEIPQSVTVKGTPGLYLPLGSPFDAMDPDQRLENIISPKKIEEMMDGAGGVFSFPDPEFNGAQVYLLHYPITEMKLDLSEAINDALMDDGEPQTFPVEAPGAVEDMLLFSLDLSNMAQLIEKMKGTEFGIEVDDPDDTYFFGLRLKIEGYSIDYNTAPEKDGTKTKYVNKTPVAGSIVFDPFKGILDSDNKLPVYAKTTGALSGTITPKMIFDWTEAEINTASSDLLNGKYPLKNDLKGFLGGDIEFKVVKGYIYIGGIDSSSPSTISLTAGSDSLITGSNTLTNMQKRPAFPGSFSSLIPADSLAQEYIDLTNAFNNDSELSYDIQISTWTIYPNTPGVSEGEKIYADMVIHLPLIFNVSTPSNHDNYVKLSLGDVLPEPGEGDIFMRTGSDDDIFNFIKSVKINLENKKNTVINDDILSILVSNTINGEIAYEGFFHFSDEEPSLKLDMDEIGYPFSPRFEILLKKETGKQFASLAIKRTSDEEPPEFDFFLTIEAVADINYSMKFGE